MRSILIYLSIFSVCLLVSMANANENGKRTKNAKNKYLVLNNVEDSKKLKIDSDEKPKKFMGRIERGKVLVLKNTRANSDEDSEEKVCRKNNKCHSEEDNSSEEPKRKQKIKYSIKFKHEKQQKHKNNNEEMRIIKLHKNEIKQYGKEDPDDEDSDENEHPYKKRLHFDEDD